MTRAIQNIFLLLFCAMLAYGGWLYWRIFAESGFSKQLKWVGYAPLGISNAYELEFTRNLSKERHPLVTGLAALKWNALDASFIRKVEKGREGWLFLKEEVPGRNELLQSLGIRPYGDLEHKLWNLIITQRAEWAKSRGIQYVLVIVPNKASMYPEYLPERYHRAGGNHAHPDPPGVHLINLTDDLIRQKSIGQLYYKNDTHWNQLGAFAGYQCLMRALPPPFRETPLPLDSATVQWTTEPGGDLARMLLMDSVLTERTTLVSVRHPQARCEISCEAPFEPWMSPKHFRNPRARLPKVFFDHDSFFKFAAPFVAEHFQETIFSWVWQGFHQDVIEATQPALVVDEFVERSLIGDRPRNVPPVLQYYWQQHFNALPQLAHLSCNSPRQAYRQIEMIRVEKDVLPVVALEMTPASATRLIVEYDDKEVAYPLEAGKKNTVYLEWERPRIKDLRVEGKQGMAVKLSVGAY